MVNFKNIYRNRFDNKKERNIIWQVLVKDIFQKNINRKDTVLEIACGYGEFINNIKCGKKIAVDVNPDAKKWLTKGVEFFLCSSTKINQVKNNSVDKIFVSNFFEHISRVDIVLTIEEFKRVLKNRGEVLILQPNIRFLSQDYWMFFDHITPIDDRALEEIFASFGFKLKQRILKFLPYTTKSNFPKSPFLIHLYLKLPFLWPIFGRQSFLVFEK